LRREQSLKKELNEFLSNQTHNSVRKKDNIKKSASWVKLGDAAYKTIKETHSRTSSKHSKLKNIKSKTNSLRESDKILKKSKSRKISYKNNT